MTANRIGYWSAVAFVGIGIAYAISLAFGFARHGLQEPIVDPILAVMEGITLASALPLVTLMAAIQERAAPSRRVYGSVALAFGTLCAGTTSIVHFVELTATRQIGGAGIAWPSAVYAAELLAWDVFLGLALTFSAAVFDGVGLERAVRRWLLICGILCLDGAIGPLVGNMRVQMIGVAGYAIVLPVVAVLLARVFARDSARGESSARSRNE